jgi:hypothetical protein
MENRLEDSLHKLWHDYLELAESYSNEMQVYEFGFAMIKYTSKMIFDCAPGYDLAYKTILAGIAEGNKMHTEHAEQQQGEE